MFYTVTFDRIGRTQNVQPLTVKADDADDLALAIHRYAQPHLRSGDYDVDVDLSAMRGFIAWGRSGSFTIATT